MSDTINRGMGWRPELPDPRKLKYRLQSLREPVRLPVNVDLRRSDKMPPVVDQLQTSCHDDQTEVLTEAGWKFFDALTGEERLATVDPVSKKLTYEHPSALIKEFYEGEMVCGQNRSLDFMITPNHKMLVRRWDEAKRTLSDDYTMVKAEDIGWYAGLMSRIDWDGSAASETYTLPGVAHKHIPQRSARTVPMSAWLKFLGIYTAEGTMSPVNGSPNRIQIAASKEREKQFFRGVCAELGQHYMEYADRFFINNAQIFSAMEAMGMKGVKAPFKRVPAFVFRQSSAMIREYLDGHFAGDGSDNHGTATHFTSSIGLAEDLQRLAFLSGAESRIVARPIATAMMADGRTVIGRYPSYVVSVCRRRNQSIGRKKSIRREQYKGFVYCAEVPSHHTLVTKRGGKVLVSGNSCVGNAWAGMLDFLAPDPAYASGVFMPSSRRFIYWGCNVRMGTEGRDEGAYISDGAKVVKEGIPHELACRFTEAKITQKPNKVAFTQASRRRKISSYHPIDGIDEMKRCLAEGFPFVFGFAVYDRFMSRDMAESGEAMMPNLDRERLLGGHAVVCVGYDDSAMRFICRNSWGEGWAMGGFFTMPMAYLADRNLSSDFWTARL